MADFVATGTVKSSSRKFTSIAARATFDDLVTAILANPWECTTYTSAGVNKPAIEKTKSRFNGKIVYQDGEAKVIGNVTVAAPTESGFDTVVAGVLADTDVRTAMGGVAAHDASEDGFSTSFKCHDANGELYTVTLTREKMTVSSYTADAILTRIETWADAQTALN